LVAALGGPFFLAIPYIPADGESVVDLRAVSTQELGRISSEAELDEYMDRVPLRKVSGLDRFTYYFSHPQLAFFYFKSVLALFVPIFAATVLVSYLHVRGKRDA
jgi:hypothetical protein